MRLRRFYSPLPQGYPSRELDAWAGRAKDWAKGGAPADLALVAPAAEKTPRDVFLYVISGDKVRNPAAAMAPANVLPSPVAISTTSPASMRNAPSS